MKCDHIRTREQGDTPFFPNMLNNGNVEVCLKEDVDAAITELKEAIRIKDKLLIENGKQIGELKQKLHDAEMHADLAEAANTEYRIDIKNIKDNIARYARTQYHKHNRQTLRALWIARARSAHNAAMMWEILSDEYLNGAQFTIDFRCVGEPDVTEFQMFRGCIDWMKIYENVERKCLAKAKEYK